MLHEKQRPITRMVVTGSILLLCLLIMMGVAKVSMYHCDVPRCALAEQEHPSGILPHLNRSVSDGTKARMLVGDPIVQSENLLRKGEDMFGPNHAPLECTLKLLKQSPIDELIIDLEIHNISGTTIEIQHERGYRMFDFIALEIQSENEYFIINCVQLLSSINKHPEILRLLSGQTHTITLELTSLCEAFDYRMLSFKRYRIEAVFRYLGNDIRSPSLWIGDEKIGDKNRH